MSMKVDQVLHMTGGTGDTSYSANSRLQGKTVLLTKPMLVNAIEEIMMSAKLQREAMVFVDLGCSSGSNTLSFIAQVLDITGEHCQRLETKPPEIQFLLNDLHTNDFNSLFQTLEKFNMNRGELFVPYYVVGVPGSFYKRLFPCGSVNLFHSSYSLQWLSQVPKGLTNDQGVLLNKGNISIASTSPSEVVNAYRKQFQRDFSTFLKYRYEELSIGGEMVLTFPGRKSRYPVDGELSCLYGLLADALNSMVLEGKIAQDKVDSFDLPVYGPSMQEVKSIIFTQGLFDLKQEQMLKYSWDPFVDSPSGAALNNLPPSGKNVAKLVRATTEPLILHQFGDATVDEVFSKYADNVSRHLLQEHATFTILHIVLKKKT